MHSLFDEETLARTHHSLDKLMREEKGVCNFFFLCDQFVLGDIFLGLLCF